MLEFRLLGKFSIVSDGRPLTEMLCGRAQELLAYVLLHRRPLAREALAARFWGDCPTSQSRKYLRQALWQLHSRLSLPPAGVETALSVEDDWVTIRPGADVRIDVAEFEAALRSADAALGHVAGNPGEALTAAVDLYAGDLLDGWYQDWVLDERERLRDLYTRSLDKLMSHCERCGEYDRALAYGTTLLAQDRARERTHRAMMRLHYASGDRTAALRQFARCRQALAEELGVEPSRQTLELHDSIRQDRPLAPADSGAPMNWAESLRAVQALLGDIEGRLREATERLQQLLETPPGSREIARDAQKTLRRTR